MSDAILTAAAAELERWHALPPEKRRRVDGREALGPPCCEWVARVIRRSHGLEADARYAPGGAWWQAANVWDPTRPWSAPYAYTEAGVTVGGWGHLHPGSPDVGAWHVVQAWRVLDEHGHVPMPGPEINGHAFLWYAIDETHGIALESSEASGVRLGGRPLAPGDVLEMEADGARVRRAVGGEDVWPQPWADRIAPYAAGVAVAVLRSPAVAAPSPVATGLDAAPASGHGAGPATVSPASPLGWANERGTPPREGRRLTRPPLSPEAEAARRPLPPEVLAAGELASVAVPPGRGRAARTHRSQEPAMPIRVDPFELARIIGRLIPVARAIGQALAKSGPGGKRITPEERDGILALVVAIVDDELPVEG